MGKKTVRYPEMVSMIRLLYAEVAAHGDDYHHVTPPERLAHVKEFLIAVDGRLPGPALPPEPAARFDDPEEPPEGARREHPQGEEGP